MSSIKDLTKEMNDVLELREFAEQQYKTILELNKKNQTLESKISLLSSQVNIPIEIKQTISDPNKTPDEKIICEVELTKLKAISMERDLTMEEAKRTEIYSKILATFREKDKNKKNNEDEVPVADLLKLVKNESN